MRLDLGLNLGIYNRLNAPNAPSAWTPADLTGLALWLDADDSSTITLNGSTVSQWDDKSGNDRHATQATAVSQPAYNATGLNGKPALITDDVDDRMNLPVITAAAGIALFFAVRQAKIGISRNGGILYASNNQSGSNHFGGIVPSGTTLFIQHPVLCLQT
jgi:hypothetical protein